MTTTSTSTPLLSGKGEASASPRWASWAWTIGVAALVGLALGRFAFVDDGAPSIAAPAVAVAAGDAVATLEAAVAENDLDTRSWQQLGTAYVNQAIEDGDLTAYSRAAAAFDRAEELLPGDPQTALGRATLALTMHHFDEALQLGQLAHEANPESADALAVLIDTNVELGRYDTALAHMDQLLDLRPALPAYSRLSYLRELHGDLTGAEVALYQAADAGLGGSYDRAWVFSLIGQLRLAQSDLDGAAAAYEDALTEYPDARFATAGLARVDAASGDRGAAIDSLEKQFEQLSKSDLILLGELLALEGRHDDAAEAFASVRQIGEDERTAGAVVDLEASVFEADHGDPAVALQLAERTYERRESVFAADALAWALFQTGQPTAALPFTEKALSLDTKSSTLLYHAAAIAAATGDEDSARVHLAAAMEGNPWVSYTERAGVRDLAESLELSIPPAWVNP